MLLVFVVQPPSRPGAFYGYARLISRQYNVSRTESAAEASESVSVAQAVALGVSVPREFLRWSTCELLELDWICCLPPAARLPLNESIYESHDAQELDAISGILRVYVAFICDDILMKLRMRLP